MNKRIVRSRKSNRRSARLSQTKLNMFLSIVAVIGCVMLVTFTTFSWIETTSSLIISSGEDGDETMDVGKNLNYQVELAADSVVSADMQDYFHKVKYFRFAKSSSSNGVQMFFPRTNATNTANAGNGYTAVTGYRLGDTADYNISYVYFDYKLKNSSGKEKDFYFKSGSSDNLFKVTGSTSAINTAVAKAMRISFVEGNASAKVYSIGNGSSEEGTSVNVSAVNNRSGSTATQTSVFVKKAEYDPEAEEQDSDYRVIQSLPNTEVEISVRIWLEEKALTDAVTPDELKKVAVSIDLALVSDNISYSQLFFDDYSYSDSPYYKRHTTDNTGYQMYLYAYNSSINGGSYVAYPMTRVANTDDSSIPRWSTSAPVDAVLSNLTDTSSPFYQNAFFGYGMIPESKQKNGSNGYDGNLSNQPLYMWKLPGAIRLVADPEDNSRQVIDGETQYIQALGIARDKATYGTHESVVGYCEYRDADHAPELVRFHDYATGLTDVGYNQNGPNQQNFHYITASNRSTTYDPSDAEVAGTNYDLYYYELPANTAYVVFNNNGQNQNQTVDVSMAEFVAGNCYHCSTYNSNSKQSVEAYSYSGTLPSSNDRIYFYNDIGWTNVHIYAFDSSNTPLTSNWPGDDMILYVPETGGSGSTVTYMNYNMYVTGSSEDPSTAAINMMYDASGSYYKAYVPYSWLDENGSLYFKYYKDGYYKQTIAGSTVTDYASIVWNAARSGSSSHDYKALGYDNDNDVYVNQIGVSGYEGLTGAGTWNAVREISFSTELIEDTIASANRYRVSTDNTNFYPMYPSPDLLKFTAYIADEGVSTPVYFKRTVPVEGDDPVETVWSDSAGTEDRIYYPVNDDDGYFHITVLCDATFDHLVSSIREDTDGNPADPENVDPDNTVRSTLTYSINNAAALDLFSNALGNNRWYVPCDSDYDVITFTWTPYDYTDTNKADTVFTYTHSPQHGIYYVITE